MSFQPYDPDAEKRDRSRGYLPHREQPGATYFVTFRLADSLPQTLLDDWLAERDTWLKAQGAASPADVWELSPPLQAEYRRRFEDKIQGWLDAGHGACILAKPAASEIVESTLRHFDPERYRLGEFVIMPNHVHVLVTPLGEHSLEKILHSWKSYSAHRLNELTQETGAVWQREYFDHALRSAEQRQALEEYVRENPTKAHLAEGSYCVGRGQMAPSFETRRLEAGAPHAPHIRSLKIRHFRCFDSYEAEFAPGLNLIVGPNARGKTSLLEAACILLRLQSPRTSRLADVIQHERRGLVVDGFHGERHLQFYFSPRRKKLALDSVEQTSSTEYLQIGRVMYFAMADIEIVRGSAEARRSFLDFVLLQREPGFRRLLRDYERALRSRNALLKAPSPRWREIEAFDSPLLAAGTEITRSRSELVNALQPRVEAAHGAISGGARESLGLVYQPGAGEDFAAALAASRSEDARLRQTCVGPHRDDLQFLVNGHDSRFASEGQQRTLVLALRLAAARLLEEHFGTPPVYLLDDVFGELDHSRRSALLAALPPGAQKLITLTSLDWVPPEAGAKIIRLGET